MAQILTSLSGLQFSAASAGFAPTNSADVSAIASSYQVVSATATQLYAGTAYVTSVNDSPLSASRAGQAANASMANSAYYDGTGRLISALPDESTVSAIASAYSESAASSKLDTTAQVVTATGSGTWDYDDCISSVNGSPLYAKYAGLAYYDSALRNISQLPDTDAVSAIASSYAESAASSKQDTLTFGYNTADQISSIDGSALGGMDEAAVSAIASAYAESAASSKQDALTFGYDGDDKISSINGSSLAGEGGGMITSIETAQDPWYQQSISGLNGSSIYPKWAASANSADYAKSASSASLASSAAAAPTGWASSFISSVFSPSGTIRVLNGNEIEGTNSAILPSTVVEGFSVVSATPQSTAFSFTVPISNPNTQVIFTGGWANGIFGISGDNGVTAESSLAGPLNVTFDMPGTTAFDVTSNVWVSDLGYTASAAASEVGGGVAELAWASALPTYQYDAEDKISSINGSAIAGGGAAGVDSATCSAIASAYAESAVSSVSGNYYTTANESGFVGSAYVDSAVSSKADSSALSSYALSADVSGTVSTVSTYSADWNSAYSLISGVTALLDAI